MSLDAMVAEQEDGAWVLSLRTGGDGSRELEGASCEEVTNAGALVIALALEPSAPAEPPLPTAAPPVGLGLVVIAALDSGTFPSTEPGLGLEVVVKRGGARGGLRALFWPKQEVNAPAPGEAGARIQLVSVGISASWLARWGRFEAGPVATLEGGAMTGEALGVTNPKKGTAGWLAVLPGVCAGWELRPGFELRGDALAGITLVGPRFEIEGVGVLHRPAPIFVRAAIGVAVALR